MRNKEKIYVKLCDILDSESDIVFYPDMSKISSFKAGGRAQMLVNLRDEKELSAAIRLLNGFDCEFRLIGKATNLLVCDEGYDGVLLRLSGKFDKIYPTEESCKFYVGAAVPLTALAKQMQRIGLSGLEFAYGIPGSLGGAIYMNAGAYGSEISELVEYVNVMDMDKGSIDRLYAEEIAFGYRDSIFMDGDYAILGAQLAFVRGERDRIAALMAEYQERRNSKQPLNYPSAGSFFKRPEGGFASKLIEDAGLKGLSFGNAQISDKHAGFIVNRGGASVFEILQLAELAQNMVWEKFGVELEPEVEVL